MSRTPGHLIEIICAALPDSALLHDWDIERPGEVRFTYRGKRFRVTAALLSVEEVDGSLLVSSDTAAILARLLRVITANRASGHPNLLLLDIINDLMSPEPCAFDPDALDGEGYCSTHNKPGPRCPHVRAAEVLRLDRERRGVFV